MMIPNDRAVIIQNCGGSASVNDQTVSKSPKVDLQLLLYAYIRYLYTHP